jgi:hypothetical protein
MSLDNYSKEQHFHELSRKDSLNNSINFPVGLATLIAGGLGLVAKTIKFPLSVAGVLQFNFTAAAVILLLMACYFLARAYWNYGYSHMPTALQLLSYCEKLRSHYVSAGQSESEAKAVSEQETEAYIVRQYAQNADVNTACNDRKSSYLYKGNGFIIAAVVPFILAASIHLYKEALAQSHPLKVEIVQTEAIKMTQEEKPRDPPPTQQTQPKPEPPPSRIIKEHVDPTKK